MVDHQFQYTKQDDLPIPKRIGEYRVIEFVSRYTEAQGSVYKALGPDDTVVAIKVIGNSFQSYSHSLIAALIGEDDLEALKREAEILSKLDHANIVKFLHTSEDAEYGTYLVMEWITGGNLRAMLLQYPERKVPTTVSSHIIAQILSAIEASHNAGIIHLDIKPENILLTEDGSVKLSDFGVAGTSNDEFTAGRGTEGYMAPEQIDLSKINLIGPRTDIYSVGILLMEMLTGYLPQRENIEGNILQEVPASLREFIRCATEEIPDSRFTSAEEALRHIINIK